MDNNAVENTIRPIAVGKKNWLFAALNSMYGWGGRTLTQKRQPAWVGVVEDKFLVAQRGIEPPIQGFFNR